MNTEHLHDWVTIEKGIYQCKDCQQLAVWNMAQRRAFMVFEVTEEMREAITKC